MSRVITFRHGCLLTYCDPGKLDNSLGRLVGYTCVDALVGCSDTLDGELALRGAQADGPHASVVWVVLKECLLIFHTTAAILWGLHYMVSFNYFHYTWAAIVLNLHNHTILCNDHSIAEQLPKIYFWG